MSKRSVFIIVLIMFSIGYPRPVPAQSNPGKSKEKDCATRDQFETEEEFQQRCQKAPATPQPAITAIPALQYELNSCAVLLNITQSQFEKDEEFQPKCQQAIDAFNQKVVKHDTLCQVGVASLGRYHVYTEFYDLTIKWQPWTVMFVALEQGTIHISREEAKTLLQESEQQPLPVFFTATRIGNKIVVDKVAMVGLKKEWDVLLTVNSLTVEEKKMNIGEFVNPKQDVLENEQQYQARRQALLKSYTQAVEQRDARYQAGSASLKKENYAIANKSFSIPITWQAWAKQVWNLPADGRIAATQEQAIALLREGEQKPVFVTVEPGEKQTPVIKPVMIGVQVPWPLVAAVSMGETGAKAGGAISKDAGTVSPADAPKVFGLNSEGRPLKYLQHDYQDQGEVVGDQATGLMWQKSGSPNAITYEDAQTYIKQLNQERFAGYDDWRLPTIPELMSLLEPTSQSNDRYINPIFNRDQINCWSVNKSASLTVWFVSFLNGYVSQNNIGYKNYVRAVRSLP